MMVADDVHHPPDGDYRHESPSRGAGMSVTAMRVALSMYEDSVQLVSTES